MVQQAQADALNTFEKTTSRRLLALLPWLQTVSTATLDAIADRIVRKCYEQWRLLYTFGECPDAMFIVISGMIQVTNRDTGLSYYCGAGSIVGEALIDGTNHQERAVCVTSTAHLLAVGAWIKELLADDPSLMKALSEQFRSHNSKIYAHVGKLYRADKKQRLPLTLIQIGVQVSPQYILEDAARFPFSIDFFNSLEHLGATIDACRITVAGSLRLLQAERAIKYLPRNGERGLRIVLEAEDSIRKLEQVLRTVLG